MIKPGSIDTSSPYLIESLHFLIWLGVMVLLLSLLLPLRYSSAEVV